MTQPETRVLFPPTKPGVGTGCTFFFFSGLDPTSDKDRAIREVEMPFYGDDVAALRAAGYTVVFDFFGTRDALVAALLGTSPGCEGLECRGVLWTGHGGIDGSLAGHDGTPFGFADLPPEVAARATCRLFVFASCWVGLWSGSWARALGANVHVEGWCRPVTSLGTADYFTPDEASEDDFDDLLRKRLAAPSLGVGPFAETEQLETMDRDLALHYEHNPLPEDPDELEVGSRVMAQWVDNDYVPAEIVAIEGRKARLNRVEVWARYPEFTVGLWRLRPMGSPADTALEGVPRIGSEVELDDGGRLAKAKLVAREASGYVARREDGTERRVEVGELRSVDGKPPRTAASHRPERGAPPARERASARDVAACHPNARVVFPPTRDGAGSGRSFYAFFGLESTSDDHRGLRGKHLALLGDDVAALRAAGYRVIVDLAATREGLLAALLGRDADAARTEVSGLLWVSEGSMGGNVYAHTGEAIGYDAIPPHVAELGTLRLAVLACSSTGWRTGSWQKALGSRVVVDAWKNPIRLMGQEDYFTAGPGSKDGFEARLREVLGAPGLGAGPFAETEALLAKNAELCDYYEHNPLAAPRESLVAGGKAAAWYRLDRAYRPVEIKAVIGTRPEGRLYSVELVETYGTYPAFTVQAFELRPYGSAPDEALRGVPRIGCEVTAEVDGHVVKGRLVARRASTYLARVEALHPWEWVERDSIRTVDGQARRTAGSYLGTR